MTNERIAIIGGGNMARSLIGGLTARGMDASLITVAEPVAAQREQLTASWRVHATDDNVAAARGAGIVLLAVKPQNMRSVATQIGAVVRAAGPTILSIAAGIPVRDLARWLGSDAAIVRSMPNRPALIGKGVSALYARDSVSQAARRAAEGVLAAVGTTLWVEDEALLDAVTAVSGSGPAYFFRLMELLEAAARDLGLPAEAARRLSIETAYGAACMAHAGVDPPAALREQVTSKGGTTAAALAVFEESDLAGIVRRAVAAAARRSAEFAAEFGEGESR